jgi:hypothetical protein
VSPGDYEDMGRFSSRTDRELDGLFSEAGEATPEDRELGDALRLTRRLIAPLDPATRTRHLAAIQEAASELRAAPASEGVPDIRALEPRWRRAVRRSWSMTLKVAAGAMAASLSLVGLAYAQVDLPGTAAENAIEAVLGVELPNQDAPQAPSEEHGKSVSGDVHAVQDATEERGCEFGRAVSDAASSNAKGKDPVTDPCTSETAADEGVAGTAATEDDESSGPGRSDAGSENAGTHDDAGQAQADESSATGQEHEADNASLGSENAGTNNDEGQTTAEERSSTGKETGETHSEQGQSHKPDQPGKP